MFNWLTGWRKPKAEASTTTAGNPDAWLVSALGGGKTASGIIVTPDTALRISAVYACVRILAESVGGLPLILYRRDGRNKIRATEHPLYSLMHDAPNDNTTSFFSLFKNFFYGVLTNQFKKILVLLVV